MQATETNIDPRMQAFETTPTADRPPRYEDHERAVPQPESVQVTSLVPTVCQCNEKAPRWESTLSNSDLKAKEADEAAAYDYGFTLASQVGYGPHCPRCQAAIDANGIPSKQRRNPWLLAFEITLLIISVAALTFGLALLVLRPQYQAGSQVSPLSSSDPGNTSISTGYSEPQMSDFSQRATSTTPVFSSSQPWPAPNPASASYSVNTKASPRVFNTLCLRPLKVLTNTTIGVIASTTYISDALSRALGRMRAAVPLPSTSFSTPYEICLTVTITTPSLSSWSDASELYSLTIPTTGDITITADSTVGVLRALATLPQLIASNAVPANPRLMNSPLVWAIRPLSLLKDKPAFPYRGVMIDTARHFMPIRDLKRQIDGMEVAKMNRLHLHLYDSQSFPLQWPGVDGQGLLWKLGAFKDASGNPLTYSAVELADLVDYAARRGIVVIPEFDMPAHTDVFNLVYPEIMSCNPSTSQPSGQLQPLVNATYPVLQNLLGWGMEQAFLSSPAFHVGQDEVHKWCWNWNNIVPADQYNFVQTMSKFQGFLTDEVVNKRNRVIMAWEDLVTPITMLGSDINPENGVPDDGKVVPTKASGKMLVQAWRGLDSFNWLLTKGYQTLFSVADYWYFSCGAWCNPGTGSISMTWAYNAPIPATSSAPANFKGGEAAFWSEETTADVLDKVVWPRAGAVAERLWTNPSKTLLTQARVELLNGQLAAVGISPWPAATVMN